MGRPTCPGWELKTENRLRRRLKMEIKLLGSSLWMLSAALSAVLFLSALCFGELIDLGCLVSEVLLPFFTAIAVGEWGRTRADANYEVIAAQCGSLFGWAFLRWLAVWSVLSSFAILDMSLCWLIRRESPLWELFVLYFPTAFLLSTLAALVGLLWSREHTSSLVCGLVWLGSLMLRSLLRIPGVGYFYLFTRFAGMCDDIWLAGKAVLCLMGLALWCLIYRICKNIPAFPGSIC